MIAKYYEFNHMDPIIELFVSGMNELNYRYYASELLRRMLHSSDIDLDVSVRKAIAILKLTGLLVQEHISCVYRSDALGINRDWKLSELACSLIIISHDPATDEMEEYRQALMKHLGI
jgi:hypothetical protein